MKNDQRNREGEDQQLRTGQNSEGNIESQQNNESLNTSSQPQPNESLRNTAAGSGRSYDYGVEGSENKDA